VDGEEGEEKEENFGGLMPVKKWKLRGRESGAKKWF
jgi:hypothetical protein